MTLLACLAAAISRSLVLFVFGRILMLLLREHTYLYQFDDRAKAIDTWIDALIPVARRLTAKRYRANVALKLSRSGKRKGATADHFIALQILTGGGTAILCVVLLNFVLGVPLYITLATTALATFFPYLRLSDIAHIRLNAVGRDLPFFIDYLSLAMSAGLDFNQALAIVIKDAPPSPIVDEFSAALANMRLGMSRPEALQSMEERMNSPQLKLFTRTLVQSMELGTDIVQTLSAMSDTLRQRRFQAAEEAAGKISVKMMIPMMCFVMPAVMIVLLGPMILSYVTAS